MLKILDLVGRVAASRATILITGNSAGRELIASAIRAHSAREAPLPVRSGSVPPDLLE
jgi:DNA-binding NtrC family response regulator